MDISQKLIEQYGYNIPSELIGYLKFYFLNIQPQDAEDDYQTIIDCCSLIDMLNSCIADATNNSYISIKGEIRKPQAGELKNTPKHIIIRSKYLLQMLKLFTNTLLSRRYSYEFEEEFNWKPKEQISDSNLFPELLIETTFSQEEIFSLFKEPFTAEEIHKILHRFKNEYLPPYRGNAPKGYNYYWEYEWLKKWGIFQGQKIKEYSFIYDIAVEYGQENKINEGFSGIVGKEKYQHIKNCIIAYVNKAPIIELEKGKEAINNAFIKSPK